MRKRLSRAFARLASSVVLGAVALALVASGCNSGKAGTIKGKVVHAGNPVSEGEVNFLSKNKGFGAVAKLENDGSFTLSEPLEPGDYAVYVTPPEAAPPPPGTKKTAAKASQSIIPMKARDPQTSGIVVTIKNGKNDLTIQLPN